MTYPHSSAIDFFDVSVVLPFYKKLDIFKRTLEKNYPYYNRNGIEVIICMDEPTEQEELLSLLTAYPLNWKVFVNERSHPWRNPSKAINVGIRNAAFKYILVMGPDSEFHSDVISIFLKKAFYYKKCFFIGQVTFVDELYKVDKNNQDSLAFLPYGSIMAERQHFISLQGYSEAFTDWGGDDDNIRARLEYMGVRKLFVPEAMLVHREPDNFGHDSRYKKSLAIPLTIQRQIFIPNKCQVNGDNWGKDFNKLIYDYV